MRAANAWDVLCSADSPLGVEAGLVVRLLGLTEDELRARRAPEFTRALRDLQAQIAAAPSVEVPSGGGWQADGSPVTLPIAPVEYAKPSGEAVRLEAVTLREPSAWDVAICAAHETPTARLACQVTGLAEGIFELMGAATGYQILLLLALAVHPIEPSPTP